MLSRTVITFADHESLSVRANLLDVKKLLCLSGAGTIMGSSKISQFPRNKVDPTANLQASLSSKDFGILRKDYFTPPLNSQHVINKARGFLILSKSWFSALTLKRFVPLRCMFVHSIWNIAFRYS